MNWPMILRLILTLTGNILFLADISLILLQIEEVRLRLNVDVIVASDSPPAPAPIESFEDMVILAFLVWMLQFPYINNLFVYVFSYAMIAKHFIVVIFFFYCFSVCTQAS